MPPGTLLLQLPSPAPVDHKITSFFLPIGHSVQVLGANDGMISEVLGGTDSRIRKVKLIYTRKWELSRQTGIEPVALSLNGFYKREFIRFKDLMVSSEMVVCASLNEARPDLHGRPVA